MTGVDRSDLEKILDCLMDCRGMLEHRDHMNAHFHMAKQTRLSPLTVTVIAQVERLRAILSPTPGQALIETLDLDQADADALLDSL